MIEAQNLNDFLNSNSAFEFEGVTYKLRQIEGDIEKGMFAQWLEQRAYDAIERRTYQDEQQKVVDRKELNQDITVGLYAFGSVLCLRAMQLPEGVAKAVQIVCRETMDDETSKRLIDYKLKEIAVNLAAQLPGATEESKANLLLRFGLPADYFTRDLKPEIVVDAPLG